MFESIVIPRKADKTDIENNFPFTTCGLDILDVRQGREIIKYYKEHLLKCFEAGFTVESIIEYSSSIMDSTLTMLWNHFVGEKFPYLALCAVGGYGRREQFPESDIDLLILSSVSPIPTEAKEAIEPFISFLWDLKLDIGSSVRTVKDTVLASREDITIISNLLETHLITGNEQTYLSLLKALKIDDFWNNEKFFDEKLKEQQTRYHTYRDTVYSLEPDIKNNPGGLRDLHIMQWIAIKVYQMGLNSNLHDIGLFTKLEYEEYLSCRRFLWNVRFALHCINNGNILRLDLQKSLANLLGYGDEGNAPVEAMMRDLFRTFLRIRELNNIVLQTAQLSIKGYVGEEFEEPEFLNSHFLRRGNYIDVIDHELFKNDPQKILELFDSMESRDKISDIHVNCLRALREARREIKDFLITIPSCRKTFKKLLENVEKAPKVFSLMHETRVLSSYMPQWAHIEGLAQFDRFHLFSVDEHIIRVIRGVQELSKSKEPIYQLFKNVYRKISNPACLITASFLHDIAKGRGGNHASKGAKDAESFCRLHGFNEYDTQLIKWLIENHLQFNTTATRRDISDLEEINKFSDFVGDEEHLNLLYLLTVADISATNENVWNSWKDNIFRQLYTSTKMALSNEGDDLVKSMQNQAQANQEKVIDITKDCKKADILKFMRLFPIEYFIHYAPEDISWHARNIIRYEHKDTPLVLFSQTPNVGTELMVYYKSSSPIVFGNIVKTMALKQLNVFSAQIFITHNYHALCTIMFQNKKGQPLDQDRLNSLRNAILAGLNDHSQTLDIPSVNHKIFDIPTTINYLDFESEKQTRLEISTLDRQGLLAKIGITFGNLGYLIRAARITTTGERADDYFAITDINGMPLDSDMKNELSATLMKVLDK